MPSLSQNITVNQFPKLTRSKRPNNSFGYSVHDYWCKVVVLLCLVPGVADIELNGTVARQKIKPIARLSTILGTSPHFFLG